MAGIIDAERAVRDFVGLGEVFETERSEEAIQEIFFNLAKARSRDSFGGIIGGHYGVFRSL